MLEQYVCLGALQEFGAVLTDLISYHLGLKPGQEVLDAIGGAHELQGWKRNILTDSGGLVVFFWCA